VAGNVRTVEVVRMLVVDSNIAFRGPMAPGEVAAGDVLASSSPGPSW
jgi:hypothetical protein